MIRGIDAQAMIQRSLEVSKIASDQTQIDEQGKEFMAQLEKEQSLRDAKTVQQTDKAEHRRVERDKDEQPQEDEYKDMAGRAMAKEHKEEDGGKEAAPNLKVDGVGFGIDISV